MTRGKTSFTPGTPLPDHWFHILLALADDSRHGLGIIEEVTAQSDLSLVGRDIRLDGTPFRVVGILARRFEAGVNPATALSE